MLGHPSYILVHLLLVFCAAHNLRSPLKVAVAQANEELKILKNNNNKLRHASLFLKINIVKYFVTYFLIRRDCSNKDI